MTSAAQHKVGKRPWRLLPWAALASTVDAMVVGAAKYGEHSWAQYTIHDVPLLLDAAERHQRKALAGQFLDPEDDIPHLAHAIASLCIALSLHLRHHHGEEYEIQAQEAPLPARAQALVDAAYAARRCAER